MNCILDNKLSWSDCNVTCGFGYQLYGQKIISEARNGGTCNPQVTDSRRDTKIPCPKIPCPTAMSASTIGLISCLGLCLLITSTAVLYLYRKNKTKVVVERIMVPMEKYDNDDLYHEENQADDVKEPDHYQDQNYNDDDDYQDQVDNDSDDDENGPRGMGGDYYTYFDEDGRFVRTNSICR